MGKTIGWTNFVTIDIPFDTDHRLLTARLKTSRIKEYQKYVKKRQNLPVTLFPTQEKSKIGHSQNELLRIIKENIEEGKKNKKGKKLWISERTYKILNSKVNALRQNDSGKVKELGKEVRRSLRKDRRNLVNEISKEIEEKLKEHNVIEAYNILRCW